MARAEKRLKDRELLLLVAAAAGGLLSGRTVAQKLVYFSGRKLGQPTGHTAYFYGPYSDEFDAAIKRGVLAGDLSERIEQIQDWFGGSDAMKHIYALTERGERQAERIAQEHPTEAREVADAVETIGQAIPGFRQKTLSAAAKIDLIITEQDRALALPEIHELANELGWKLTEQEVNEALDVLERLDLAEVSA